VRRTLFLPPLVAFCAVAAATTGVARAASTPTVVSAAVTPFTAAIGDRLTLTIVIEHEPGMTFEGPPLDADFGGAEAIARAEPEREAIGGGERTTLRYTIVSFQTGAASVAPLEIAWRGADGSGGTVTAPPAPYAIESTVDPGDDTLRPLKPQLEIPQPAPPSAVPAAVVAAMAGLTAFGYWLVRRTVMLRPPSAAPAPAAPSTPPEDVARGELAAIAAAGLAERDPAQYYARVAAAVRRYLSDRFAFPAYAMTRREMERGMRRAGIDRWPARLTANLLEQCDAVQFAMFRPAMERREQDLAAAYEIVRLTSPPERGPDEPQAERPGPNTSAMNP
jgi:hypothetical protein